MHVFKRALLLVLFSSFFMTSHLSGADADNPMHDGDYYEMKAWGVAESDISQATGAKTETKKEKSIQDNESKEEKSICCCFDVKTDALQCCACLSGGVLCQCGFILTHCCIKDSDFGCAFKNCCPKLACCCYSCDSTSGCSGTSKDAFNCDTSCRSCHSCCDALKPVFECLNCIFTCLGHFNH